MDQHRSETDSCLRILKNYLEAVEKALGAFEPQVKKAINDKSETIPGRFVEAANEKIQHIVRFTDEYPKQLRYSFIVQLYIALESRGKALCNEINKRNTQLLLTVSDLDGRGSFRGIQTFLTKVSPVRGVTAAQWSELDDLRVMRNCLVHKNGEIDSQDKRLEQIIAKKQGVGVGYDGYLGIERSYCDKALQSVIAFFETVFEEMGFGVSFFKSKAEWAKRVQKEVLTETKASRQA